MSAKEVDMGGGLLQTIRPERPNFDWGVPVFLCSWGKNSNSHTLAFVFMFYVIKVHSPVF